MSKKCLTESVSNFLTKSSEIVGNFEDDSFHSNTFNELLDLNIASPIEQLFYVAFNVLRRINFEEELEPIDDKKVVGLGVQPQCEIQKYRVDFLAMYYPYDGTPKEAVVECDGHDFHDQDEAQRRYEKQRDRFLQTQGLNIFHFTGAEITQNPYGCAAEVIAYLLDRSIDDILDPNLIDEPAKAQQPLAGKV